MFFKSMEYLIFALCIYHSSFGENILEKYPTGLKNRHLLSCRNQCGKGTGVCSCASGCQVYGNCCEDFTDVCSKEAEGTAKLPHLYYTFVKCENHHFIDTSCNPNPSVAPMSTTTFSLLTTQSSFTTTNEDLLPSNLDQGLGVVLRIFNQRPVTDLLSGVHFGNDLFKCNSLRLFRNASHWDIEIEVQSEESFSDGNKFIQIIGNGFEWFPSSSSVSESMRTDFCLPDAIRLCPDKYKELDPFLYTKCQSFVSYIRLIRNGLPVYYGNIYCMKCCEETLGENITEYTIITRGDLKTSKPSGLFVLITGDLKSPNGFEMTSIQNTFSRAFSWSKTRCKYHKRDLFRCSDFVCKPGTFKADNGMCLFNNTFRLAIGDDGSPLTSNGLAKFPSMFSCIIGNTIPQVIDKNQRNTLQPIEFYDERLQMTVYVFEINIHWPRSTIDYTNESLVYEVIDIVSKTLWRYSTTGTTVGADHDKPKSLTDKVTDNLKLKTYDIEEYFSDNPLWYEEKVISNSSRITTSCLCMRDRNLEQNCDLFCWQTPYFQGDSEKIEEYLSSECFAKLSSSSIPNQTPILSMLLDFALLWLLPKSI